EKQKWLSKRDTERYAAMRSRADCAAGRADHEGVHDQAVARTIADACAVFEPGRVWQRVRRNRAEVVHVDDGARARAEAVGDPGADIGLDGAIEEVRVSAANSRDVQGVETGSDGSRIGIDPRHRLRIAARLHPASAEVAIGRGFVGGAEPRE